MKDNDTDFENFDNLYKNTENPNNASYKVTTLLDEIRCIDGNFDKDWDFYKYHTTFIGTSRVIEVTPGEDNPQSSVDL